jgi:hypothetical protein
MRLLPTRWKVLVQLGPIHQTLIFLYHDWITTACQFIHVNSAEVNAWLGVLLMIVF